MPIKVILLFVFVLFSANNGYSQSRIEKFLTPADSLIKKRVTTIAVTESVLLSSGLIGLHALWYKNFPKSDFHFINDNGEWLQMDKIGHVFSAYHIGRASAESFKWAGSNKKTQLVYGGTLGLAFLSVVEIFDGYSKQWGASHGDIIANAAGTSLFIGQDLLWNEQRITPKFSFYTTEYAALRPNVLGSSISEQILKDYNGQTYWLSVNLFSFNKASTIPKWLNLAIGYGADGMLTGNGAQLSPFSTTNQTRIRQFYLSVDLDLTKINTKSHVLKTLFSVLNTIKIPAPTIEINSSGRFHFHAVYF